jgi:hypothetical protein
MLIPVLGPNGVGSLQVQAVLFCITVSVPNALRFVRKQYRVRSSGLLASMLDWLDGTQCVAKQQKADYLVTFVISQDSVCVGFDWNLFVERPSERFPGR